MKKRFVVGLIGLVLAGGGMLSNFTWMALTEVEIHNSYTAPISYAVDSSPEEAKRELTKVKEWMEREGLTQGNSCVFITSNPYCDLDKFYSERVVKSIEEIDDAVNSKDPTAVSNLSLKLNERFLQRGDKGQESVRKPINFGKYLRYKDSVAVGWWIDFLCWTPVVLAVLLAAAIPEK